MRVLGPRLRDGVAQISGQCAVVVGNTDADYVRLIELHFEEPVSGMVIVTTSQPGLDWRTRMRMGSGLGGPELVQDWHQAKVALSWAGQDLTLEVREGQSVVDGTRFCAAAGLNGATADSTTAFDTGGTTPAEATRIQDGALNLFFASVLQNTGLPASGALAAVGSVVGSAVVGALLSGAQGMRLDDNGVLVARTALRQARVRGVIAQTAFGVGGTATLIAAPGANLANALGSVQIGIATVATVVTLESPSATVLWSGSFGITNVRDMRFDPPLLGATNGAWVVRSSAASTFSANGQGFTERVA